MRHKRAKLLMMALFLALASSALASTTWYVNGVSGSNSNNCLSPSTACKTIGHAISLALSGDSIMVAAATYTENLTIRISLKVIGAGASTTIIDGGGVNIVVTITGGSHVTLSKLTIRNGKGTLNGGGIFNSGALTLNRSIVTGNSALNGGGIFNNGALTLNGSIVSGNSVSTGCSLPHFCGVLGGGIDNSGRMTINNSTVSGNSAHSGCSNTRCSAFGGGIYNEPQETMVIRRSTISGNVVGSLVAEGGGIFNGGTLFISNSTVNGNTADGIETSQGGGIWGSTVTVSNTTFSGNSAPFGDGGAIYGSASLQNSIVANSPSGGNCSGTLTSNGYNLSSDRTCNFSNTGDLNNTNPQLGPLQNNGGPTQTQALLSGSPAIDAGNPNGCTDGLGHLLTTDQRGKPRPDTEDTGGCDMGAFERQSD